MDLQAVATAALRGCRDARTELVGTPADRVGRAESLPHGLRIESPSIKLARSRPVTRVCLVFGSVLLAALLLECGLRMFFGARFSLAEDVRNLMYQYDPQLGWFPIPNASKQITW